MEQVLRDSVRSTAVVVEVGGEDATKVGGPARRQAKTGTTPSGAFDPEVVQALVRESRLAQGLPERITDPGVLARLAVLVNNR